MINISQKFLCIFITNFLITNFLINSFFLSGISEAAILSRGVWIVVQKIEKEEDGLMLYHLYSKTKVKKYHLGKLPESLKGKLPVKESKILFTYSEFENFLRENKFAFGGVAGGGGGK